LRLSPSVVTRTIAQLEDGLGLTLLLRTTRSLRLTERGELYLASCQQILQDLDDAERRVRGEDAEPRGALKIAGEVIAGAQFIWAGVFFDPGSSQEDAVDLSKKKTISFWAKGDGKNYSIAVQTQTNAGSVPTLLPFVAGPEWKQYSFPLSSFDTDGHDVTGIAFARSQEAGQFEFELDEVEIQ